VLTVPFGLIHHGSKPYAYAIPVTVNGAIDPGTPRTALTSIDRDAAPERHDGHEGQLREA
jgi:hypothetical protein